MKASVPVNEADRTKDLPQFDDCDASSLSQNPQADIDRLKASEERYRRLFETAQDGILILDAATGQIEDVNPYLCKLFEYEPDHLLGQPLESVAAFRDIAANYLAQHASLGKESLSYSNLPFETKQGQTIYFELQSSLYSSGNRKFIQCNVRNVTGRKWAEELLIQSRQRLALATESAQIGIWDWDVVEDKLVWDQQMYALYGIDENDFSGAYSAWQSVLHPEDRARAEADMAAALAGSRTFYTQFRVLWPNGEVRRIEANAVVQRAQDGTPLHVIGVNRDITERSQMEEALRIGQERFEMLSRATNDVVWDWNIETNRLWWNTGFETLFGYDRDTVDSSLESWKRNIHSDDFTRITSSIKAAIEGDQYVWADEYRFRKAEGSYATIFDRGFIIRDDSHRPVRMVGSMQDITQRKEAEEALRSSESRNSAVIQNALDCIITINHQGRVVEFNPAAEATFGYSRAEALGQDLNDLIVPPALHKAHNEGIAHYIATGEGPVLNRRVEVPAVCRDGREITVELAATAIDHSDPPLFTAYLRDITERKQAEMDLRASEERFQSIVANVPGMVYQFQMQPDGSISWPFVSQGCREVFDVEPEFIKENPQWALDAVHPEDQSDFQRSVTASADSLLPRYWEGRIRLASGQIKWIAISSRPQPTPEGDILWNGLLTDITSRKVAEDQRDRFFSMSLDMLGIVGLDGYFKRLNPAFSETLNYSECELMSRPLLEFVHPDDRAATERAMQDLKYGNSVVGFENRYRRTDGSWRWLEWKAVPVADEGVFYAAARDVTKQKEVETKLLLMRDQLEEHVKERTAELAEANAALQVQIVEREEAEAETRTRARQQEAVAELGRRALADIDTETLMNGATALVAATLDVEISTILELLPDGQALRVRAESGSGAKHSQIQVPAKTNSHAGYTLLREEPVIVADLRTETRFQPSTLLLKRGVTSAVTVIVEGYQRHYGILAAYAVRQRHFSQDDVNFLQAMANVLAAALHRNKVETEIRELNSQLQETNNRLRIENQERHMALGALQEAVNAHQVATMEAERANRAKSEFLSRMSHELRTPLNAILGFGQIMEKEDLDPVRKESIGYILQGGRHLLDLINEVLDIARVEAGRMEIVLAPIALDEIVPEVCALVRPLAAEHNISVQDNTSTLEHKHVVADRQRLKQVLLNLISNAIKYNRPGGQVEIRCESERNGWMSIAVRDTGYGISESDLTKLFTPFERLGASASGIEGTGLGLVLSQRLVMAMGGTLRVESRLGQGTTFTIELEQASSMEENTTDLLLNGRQLNVLKQGQQSFCVLCIEDNPSHIRLLELVFQDRPEITLLTAMLGGVGLDMAREHEPDLILLDLNLPDINGRDILSRLQKSALTNEIPVVVISADATSSQVDSLLAAGAKACLTKPLDVSQFLDMLDQTLQLPAAISAQPGDQEEPD